MLNSVSKQIISRFFDFGGNEQEEHKGRTYKQVVECFKDSIGIMLKHLHKKERNEILQKISNEPDFFEQFTSDMV